MASFVQDSIQQIADYARDKDHKPANAPTSDGTDSSAKYGDGNNVAYKVQDVRVNHQGSHAPVQFSAQNVKGR